MADRVAVIMAGGAGERFWPLSRRHRPKQLLRLTGKQTLLEESVERAVALVGGDNLYVATGADQAPLVEKALPQISARNIFREPVARDTSGCLALALAHLKKRGGDPTMAVMTADHCISRIDRFQADFGVAFEQAESQDVLVTFGIQPTRPDTGFGYIELDEKVAERRGTQVFKVRRFREKPNAETARAFLEAGNFLWNSGMFVWRCSVLKKAMEDHAPHLARAVDEMAEAIGSSDETEKIARVFEQLPKISIDFAVMEHARNVRCVRATFHWDDVGTWSALARLHPSDSQGNIVLGEAVALDTSRSIIYGRSHDEDKQMPLVATLGVKDMIIVVSDDAILVCHRDYAQRMKEIVKKLRESYGDRYC